MSSAGIDVKVTVVAMGKLKAKYALLATDDFLKRASRFFIEHIVKDVRRGRSSSHQDWRVKRLRRFLKYVPKNAVLIALDEHGKQRNSTDYVGLKRLRCVDTRTSFLRLAGPMATEKTCSKLLSTKCH